MAKIWFSDAATTTTTTTTTTYLHTLSDLLAGYLLRMLSDLCAGDVCILSDLFAGYVCVC
jgi:hypothetical protein